MAEKWKKVSGSTLKLMGIFVMLIDHTALAVISRLKMKLLISGGQPGNLQSVYSGMKFVGRLGFPIFCFLLLEGFEKTRNRGKYLFRLGLFALISEIPYDLAFSSKVLEFHHQNVFFTLFLGLLSLCAYAFMEKHKLPALAGWLMCAVGVAFSGAWLTKSSWHFVQTYILSRLPGMAFFGHTITEATMFCAICISVAALLFCYRWRMGRDKMLRAGTNLAILSLLMILADLLHTDYLGAGVLTVTVMYIFRKHNVLAMAGGCAALMLKGLKELPAFLTVIPIAMYNGKRGLRLKYFFYVFYPAHLLLLWLIAWLMGVAYIPVF